MSFTKDYKGSINPIGFSLTNAAWPLPILVTYSFIPDGTSIAGTPSNLFATWNAVAGSTAAWQALVEEALATWQSVAFINFTLASDGSYQEGISGKQQGDNRFGDIRISGTSQAAGVLGVTFTGAHSVNDTTASDSIFATTAGLAWGVGSGFDIQTVVTHEMGHALGLDHSADATAIMYATYSGIKLLPTTDDVLGIQAVYGAPQVIGTNASLAKSYDITPWVASNQITLTNQYVAGATDQKWYRLVVPNTNTGTMYISAQATGLSLLAPKVSLFSSAGTGISTAGTPNDYGSTATLSRAVSTGETYYVRVIASNTGPGSAGSFALLVNFASTTPPASSAPSTVTP